VSAEAVRERVLRLLPTRYLRGMPASALQMLHLREGADGLQGPSIVLTVEHVAKLRICVGADFESNPKESLETARCARCVPGGQLVLTKQLSVDIWREMPAPRREVSGPGQCYELR
jgi:hypothetical protein